MIYVLNYYSRILTYPNGELISSKNFRLARLWCNQSIVVVGLQTYPDTVFNIDGVNKTPNLTFQINSSNGSLVKKFRII